jgi:ferredoxin-NADP reductase/MOSC domain-containing protein YiiM
MPRDVPWQERTVHTGAWKYPVTGRRRVRRLNLDGDGQGDTNGHGGEIRAVLVYQIQSYQHWRRHLKRDDLTYGEFGENLTVDGLPDDEVCIGDRYRIGTAEFEVTQPRVTCYRVGLRLGQPDMAALLVAHHRPGFYCRVISEGFVGAGDAIVKTASGPGGLTVTDTDALLYLPHRDVAKLRVAVTIPALSPGWQSSFHDLLQTKPAASPPGADVGWTGFRKLRVAEVVRETETVTSIYLAPEDGRPLPAPRPGQYLTLRVAGAGSPPPVRTYSLSSAPDADTYRISVKREPHGLVSGYLQSRLLPGASLDVASPRGEFVLDGGADPVLLLSAGIGVTPVLAMLQQLAAQHSERDVWWIHAARRPAEQALGGEAHKLMASLPSAHEHIFYSAYRPEELRVGWATAGRLSAESLQRLRPPTDASAYICGPAAFMTDMQRALEALGVAADRIHTELFGALSSINPGLTDRTAVPPHPPEGPVGTGPLVTFSRSGLSVPFDTPSQSLLDLADECDVPTRWSCRTGVCHTCETPLLAGTVDYSPDPLEPPPEGRVLICCCRPTTDVVLDM